MHTVLTRHSNECLKKSGRVYWKSGDGRKKGKPADEG